MKAFQAHGNAGTTRKATAREAAAAYFEQFPKSRKCDVIEGEYDGAFFTVRYGRKSEGDYPKSFKNVTKKGVGLLPE